MTDESNVTTLRKPNKRGGARQGSGRPKGFSPEKIDAYTELAQAKAKRERFRAELEELKYLKEVGSVVLVTDYELALAKALKSVAVTLESLPDVLERDAGISGEAVEKAQVIIDRIRDDLFHAITVDL